jgi:hypothetical protein
MLYLERFGFQIRDGHRYLGGFLGSTETQEEWLQEKVETWAAGVQALARVARRFPQTAYAGLAKSLQCEWQYLQRVIPDVGDSFAPIEKALVEDFFPALLQVPPAIVADLRPLLGLSAKFAGIGLPCPTQTANPCHQASLDCTEMLTTSLYDRDVLDAGAYASAVRNQRATHALQRRQKQEAKLARLKRNAGNHAARRMKRRVHG